ncbi:MAG: hypothetical protein ACK4UT_05350, partial [Moraxellaceae bacterium]
MPRPSRALLWLALTSLPCTAPGAAVDSERLGWTPRAALERLPAHARPKVDATCPGAWVTPIPADAAIGDPLDSDVRIQA